MHRRILIVLIFCLLPLTKTYANSNPPKREFRGAWIATVVNLDWPSSRDSEAQRLELIRILDELKDAGINAVVFQIRPECDALYQSSYEPWSYYLTGNQGTAPSPFYDPLKFAIEEAHKRGIELHAWFNPYRAVRYVNTYPNHTNHVSVKHPEWILNFPAYPNGTQKILNPGLPEVRDYVTGVIMDVVHRYDVDGVHFDDYFYPYPDSRENFSGITNEDDQTFANYSRGFTNRGDWRRDNVNLLIKMVHDSIQVVKPYVKFGVSPFGIWKDYVPSGIRGLDAYNVLYADALAWLNAQIVDYITPQLYWVFGGGQDYGKLLPWWASKVNGRHLYPGQIPANINARNWSANEILNQISLNRKTPNVFGNVFFRATEGVTNNPKGLTDFLKADFYRYPTLFPVMSWKDSIPPNMPQNLRYEPIASSFPPALQWDPPVLAADGDSAIRYVVYRFEKSDIQLNDLENATNISALSGVNYNIPETPPNIGGPYYYVVTALDRNANESGMSQVISIYPPGKPVLASPLDGDPNQPPEVILNWYRSPDAVSYQLQVSIDSTFASQLFWDESAIVDTFLTISELEGQQTYYWRVNASNAGGTANFSDYRSFATGFPTVPFLVYPANNEENIPIEPAFTWNSLKEASSYRLQIATRILFGTSSTVFDSSAIVDTTFSAITLDSDRFYFWRVSAANSIGTGIWSEIFKFKTIDMTLVAEISKPPVEYKLYQNYPNPFNAMTIIPFDIPQTSHVVLKLYDILGREVATIVDQPFEEGHHEVIFDGYNFSSGVYLYQLLVNNKIFINKMILLK